MAASLAPSAASRPPELAADRLGSKQIPLLRAILLELLALGLLVCLPRLYFWRLFTSHSPDQMTIAEGDFTQEYFPVLVTASRALQDGELPLWNPYSNGGQPLLADPQAALLYPLTWLALRSIRGFDGDSLVALEWQIPLHVALAGIFAYALGRVALRSRVGGLVAGLTFAYSGFLTSYPVQQLPILRTVVWFPLELLCCWLALEGRSLRWAVAGGLAVGLSVLAGHPQTTFLSLVGLAVLGATWTYAHTAATGRWTGRGLATLLVIAGAGLGVSAVQWLPTLELTRLSSRPGAGYEYLAAGFSLWELPLDALAPRVLGGLPPYVGLLPLMLAAVGLWTRRAPLAGAAAMLALAGLLLSLGGKSFLYPLLYQLGPGFDLFRQQERAIFLYSMGMALLAGGGAVVVQGRLVSAERRRLEQVARLGGLVLAALLALGGAVYVGQLSAEASQQGAQRWREMVHWLFFGALVLGLALAILLLRTRVRHARPALPALMLALIGFDLFTVSWEANLERRRPEEVFRASEIVKRLVAEVGLARADDQGVLNGGHGLVYGVPTVTRSFVLHLRRLDEAEGRLSRSRWYDLLNVAYVVTREPRPELGEPLVREPFRDITNLLYRRIPPGAAYVVPEAIFVGSAGEALEWLADDAFDLRRQVVIESPHNGWEGRWGGEGTIEKVTRGWNRVEVEARLPEGGYLVLSEVAYPGWRAEVDGQPAPILRANYLLRAVALPPGAHHVRMWFEPDSLRLGAALSVLTLACAGLWLGWPLARLGATQAGRRLRRGEQAGRDGRGRST